MPLRRHPLFSSRPDQPTAEFPPVPPGFAAAAPALTPRTTHRSLGRRHNEGHTSGRRDTGKTRSSGCRLAAALESQAQEAGRSDLVRLQRDQQFVSGETVTFSVNLGGARPANLLELEMRKSNVRLYGGCAGIEEAQNDPAAILRALPGGDDHPRIIDIDKAARGRGQGLVRPNQLVRRRDLIRLKRGGFLPRELSQTIRLKRRVRRNRVVKIVFATLDWPLVITVVVVHDVGEQRPTVNR